MAIKISLFGASGHGKVILDILQTAEQFVDFVYDDHNIEVETNAENIFEETSIVQSDENKLYYDFEFGKIENFGQGSKLKVLDLWTEKELQEFFESLLQSKTALDATQADSLKIALQYLPLPKVTIAIKETLMDVEEGADIVMMKPALSYLDIIREVKNAVNVPVSAYNISGEYAMIKAAAEKGWINEDKAIMEVLTSIKRAGADLIATYFAKDFIKIIFKTQRNLEFTLQK